MKRRDLDLMRYKGLMTKQYLKREYNYKKKSILKISQELDVDWSTVQYYILFYNLKLRSHKEQAAYSSKGGERKYKGILTKSYLIREYVKKKRSIKDLAEELKIYKGTVRRYLLEHGISIRTAAEQIEINHPPKEFDANNVTKSFIDGLLLGDASIPLRSNGTKPRSFTQMCKYREYLDYISKRLLSMGIKCSPIISWWAKDVRCKNGGYYQSFLQTKRYKTFESFRERWYPEGKKTIPHDFIVNKESMMQCYLCDGNFYREIRLCLDAFEKKEILFLRDKIRKEININSRIITVNGRYELAIKKSDTANFLRYISECPVNCYSYKWKDNESEEAKERKRLNARVSYLRKKNARK